MVKSLVISDVLNGDYEFISNGKYRVTLAELKVILRSLGNSAGNVVKSVKRNRTNIIITLFSGIVFIVTIGVFLNTVSFASYVLMIISGADFINNLNKKTLNR